MQTPERSWSVEQKCFLSVYKLKRSRAGTEFPDSPFLGWKRRNRNFTLKSMLALLTLGGLFYNGVIMYNYSCKKKRRRWPNVELWRQPKCDSNTNVYKPAECFSSTLLKYQDTHTLHVLWNSKVCVTKIPPTFLWVSRSFCRGNHTGI